MQKAGRRPANYSHGESHTRLHNIWCGINNRCNPNHKHTGGYGKRGIKVCEEWKNYVTFAKWARENGYADDLTIERIDVNGDYAPENCKWIKLEKQARNRRTTRWVVYKGEKISLAEAAERAGLPYKQVHARIKSGWSEEDALTVPIKQGNGIVKRCRDAGLNYHTVYGRINSGGWTEEDALSIKSIGKGANQTSYQRKR